MDFAPLGDLQKVFARCKLKPMVTGLIAQLPNSVMPELLPHGGHVGFVHGALPGRIDWLPQRLLAHFACHLPPSRGVR